MGKERDWSKYFWGGKMEKYVNEIGEDVPRNGKVKDKKRPVLEQWRKYQNAYYRHYNDGDAFISKLRPLFNKYKVKVSSGWHDKKQEEALEELGDKLLYDALVEKAAIVKEGKEAK